MNEQTKERTNEWMNKQTNERKNEHIHKWIAIEAVEDDFFTGN